MIMDYFTQCHVCVIFHVTLLVSKPFFLRNLSKQFIGVNHMEPLQIPLNATVADISLVYLSGFRVW